MKEQRKFIVMSEQMVDLVVKGDIVLQGQTVENGFLAIDRGRAVYSQGEIVGPPGHGKFITGSPALNK